MKRVDQVLNGEELEGMLTIKQLASQLGVSYSRAAGIVQELKLPFRYATREEEDLLVEQGRIKGLPATAKPGNRVKLLPSDIVSTARGRRRRGWSKDVPRKKPLPS